jgi:hypothetical protein
MKTLCHALRAWPAGSVLAGVFCLALQAASAADFTCTTNNNTITITKYNGAGGDVAIPSEITGVRVTTIGASAFYLCTRLTNVIIPDSVISIGNNAFYGCANLTNATFGTNVILAPFVP